MNALRIFVDFTLPADTLQLLRDGTAGHELIFPAKPAASVLSRPEPDPLINTADVAFGQPDPALVATTERLKWIHASTSGITRYETSEFRALLKQKQIVMTNSASVYNEACAVHVLSFMLAQTRQLPAALKSRAANGSAEWNVIRQASGTLRDEAVLILGYGAIGTYLAELLKPFGAKVTGYRRRPRGDEGVPMVDEHGLSQALGAADHVINILPDNAQSRHFFDATRLAQIKRDAVFYNIGRGTTVYQDGLLNALRSHHLRAAWLDVTDPEPLPSEHPLRQQPNCFITPHVAGGHTDEVKTLVRHFLRNLERYTKGTPLQDRVLE